VAHGQRVRQSMASVLDRTDAPAPVSSDPGRYDAFLSYAREDSDFVIDWLLPRLRERGHEVWIDVDITGGAKWRDRVERGIEACKALIFVVTPASVASEACGQELEAAAALNKLIIPVVHEDVEPALMPDALADAEWVFLRTRDEPATGMDRLTEALKADLAWRDQHTRLAGRAREWLDSGRNKSYLLRGADLREAEVWLATQGGHREAPTREQGEFIARSRQVSTRRLYTLVGVLSAGLVTALALAAFALIQRQNAIHQSHSAQSRALAASSLLALSDDPELSLLLSRQAVREQHTPQAQQALRSALANSHVRRTMVVPNNALRWAGFTPDARKIVVVGGIGPSYVFDAGTGRLVKTLYTYRYKRPMFVSQLSASGSRVLLLPNIGPPVVLDVSGRSRPVKLIDPTDSWFSDATISADGRTAVAITLHSQKARLFDTRTGRILRTWPGHPGRVALGPDGTYTALAAGRSVTTYAGETEARRATIPFATYPSIVFSPDGYLFVATDTGVSAWNPATGGFVAAMQGLPRSFRTAAWPLAFSRSGGSVAGVSSAGQLFVWDARTGSVRAHIVPPGHTGFSAAALSPDGRYVVTTGSDGIARLWSTRDATMLTEFRGVVGGVTSVAFSLDGKQVLTAGEDGTARIWDPGLGLPVKRRRFPLTEFGTGGALGTRWGDTFVLGDTKIPVFDLRSGQRAFHVKLPRPAWDVTLAAHAPVMAVTYEHAPVEVLDLARRHSGSLPGTDHVVPKGGSAVQPVVISRDGRRVLVGVGDRLTVWDVRTRTRLGHLRDHVGGEFPASATAFSPDGHLLATVRTDGVIVLWRADDGRVIAREHAEQSPGFNASVPVTPAFSADGSLVVAAGNWDRGPGVWRTSDGRLVSKLTQSFNTVAFSPTEALLVTDGAFVWDAESGRLLLTLRDPTISLDHVAFTSDGLRVVGGTYSSPYSIREIFPCDVCGSLTRLMHLAGQRITRSFTAAERDRYLR
jgi:WD40 repeat protein